MCNPLNGISDVVVRFARQLIGAVDGRGGSGTFQRDLQRDRLRAFRLPKSNLGRCRAEQNTVAGTLAGEFEGRIELPAVRFKGQRETPVSLHNSLARGRGCHVNGHSILRPRRRYDCSYKESGKEQKDMNPSRSPMS